MYFYEIVWSLMISKEILMFGQAFPGLSPNISPECSHNIPKHANKITSKIVCHGGSPAKQKPLAKSKILALSYRIGTMSRWAFGPLEGLRAFQNKDSKTK